jgi:threonine/homoserine/homoserine lactone efflux protein
MVLRGFRFGMLLQLAVGPVCIFIFQTASLKGFYTAETGVLGVFIVDGLFILAAILGIASVIEKDKVKMAVRAFGAAVLLIFGASTILGQFGVSFLPGLNIQSISGSSSVFLKSILLTASNPLTIIFWAGALSSKIAGGDMKQKDIYAFGFGAAASTVFFLTFIALAGSLTKTFLTPFAVQALNMLVGILLIYFGIRMVIIKN